MANGEVQQNDKFVYILTLGNTITAPSKNLEVLELIQEESVTVTDKEGLSYFLNLNGVKINKKIYEPNEIEVELIFRQVTNDTSKPVRAPSFSEVSDLLLQRQAKVEILKVPGESTFEQARSTNSTFTIAESYYVFEVDPMLKRESDGTIMTVKMSIFSMDKLMTLNKYSKAYVARKLGSGILKPESLNFGTLSEGVPLIKSDPYHLRFLKYTDTEVLAGVNGEQVMNIQSEFIQPYLVQYNETFYDFLVRTANRCGEFLFFEDGQLTLGLPSADSKSDPTLISGFNTVTIQKISSDPLNIKAYSRDSMKEENGDLKDLNQTVVKKQSTGYPKDAFAESLSSNTEQATDEYIFPLYKDKFSSLKRETYYDRPLYKVLNGFKALTAGDDAVASAVGFGVGEGILAFTANSQVGTTNALQEKAQMEPYKGKDEQYNEEKVVQFSSLNTEGWTTVKFYDDRRKSQEEQQRQIICIDMGANVIPVKLGQKIKVDGGVNGTFVVIQINQVSDTTWTRDYNKYDHTASDRYIGKRSLKIYAIPSYKDKKDNEQFVPPVHPVPIIRKVGPQTAFVTDNNDPKYQGRVRVAFPWQTLGKAEKIQLDAAESALKKAEEDRDKKKAWSADLLTRKALLIREQEELNQYVKASASERLEMMAEKQKKYDEANAALEDIEAELARLQKEKENVESEISSLGSKYSFSKESKPLSLDISYLPVSIKYKNKVFEKKSLEEAIATTEKKKEIKRREADTFKQKMEEMQAAAEEYDQNQYTTGYVNSVISKKGADLEAVKEDLEKAPDIVKDAITEADTKKKEHDQIKEYIENILVRMSTPWIRVATPMATTGGGTYFKPQIGDEVFVNFENGNIERPYVTGSLFSKNVLDPYEGFERKGAPGIQWGTGKQVSMTMMSPNGHHITFSDPDKGDKFFYGLNPGLQFWGPFYSGKLTPGLRDLAGGIHIGDRYGIYEIEMSTHDRYVNIKSPLGTVNINAFTGITIDAPNGDVKIRGKNVSIEAGNNLTLTSGTNIKPKPIGNPDYFWGSPIWTGFKHWYTAPFAALMSAFRSIRYGLFWLGHQALAAGPAVANDMLGPAAFADLSLIRHMLEIGIKPVEGATLIKSKRYLRLEAGSGTATIKYDRFPNKEKIDSQEKFYQELIEVTRDLNDRIDNFYEQYSNYWDAAFKASSDYHAVADTFLKNPEDPDLREQAFTFHRDEWDEDLFYAGINFDDKMKDEDVEYSGKTYHGEEKKEIFYIETMLYAKLTFTLHKLALNFPNLLNDYPDDNVFKKAAKEAFKQYAEEALKKWKERYGDDKPKADFAEWAEDLFTKQTNQTLLKRKTIALYMIKVSESQLNKDGKFLYLGYGEKDIVDGKLRADYSWKNFMTHFDHGATYGQKWMIYLLDGLWEPMKKRWKNPFAAISENKIWDKQSGQILFSDNDGSTLHFEGSTLKSETQSNLGNRDQLVKLLLSIK